MSEKFEKLFEKYSNMDKPTRIAYAKVAASKLLTYLYKEVNLSKQESILIAFSIISLLVKPNCSDNSHILILPNNFTPIYYFYNFT